MSQLTNEQINRYKRHIILPEVGAEGQKKLLNAKVLHMLPFGAVAGRLSAMDVGGGEAFWQAVRSNLAVLADAAAWWRVVNGPLKPMITDASICDQAVALLPPEPWDEQTWERLAAAVKQATGAKGKALFQPLRLALTAREHGPEQAAIVVHRVFHVGVLHEADLPRRCR